MNFSMQKQWQRVKSLSVWCFFYPNKRAVTFCFSPAHLLPLLLVPGGGFATRSLPAASSSQQKHCSYSILFFSPPSQWSYYSALFCIWPGGDGRRNTLAMEDNVLPQSWNLRAALLCWWFCSYLVLLQYSGVEESHALIVAWLQLYMLLLH